MRWREDVKGVYGIDPSVRPCFYSTVSSLVSARWTLLLLPATLHVQPEYMLYFLAGVDRDR